MQYTISFDKHLLLIDSIIKSVNELVIVLTKNPKVNEMIHITLGQILLFLSKIIQIIPKILISQFVYENIREELINSLELLIIAWDSFSKNSELFFLAWDDFYFLWEDFSIEFKQFFTSKSTIFLSMN